MTTAGKITTAMALGVTLVLGTSGTAQAKPPAPKIKIAKHADPNGHRIIAKLKIPNGYQAGPSWIHLQVADYVHGKTSIMTGKNDLHVYEPGRSYTWKARVKYRTATQIGTRRSGTTYAPAILHGVPCVLTSVDQDWGAGYGTCTDPSGQYAPLTNVYLYWDCTLDDALNCIDPRPNVGDTIYSESETFYDKYVMKPAYKYGRWIKARLSGSGHT